MTFSKEEYWENRKAGKRGQGERPKLEVVLWRCPNCKEQYHAMTKHVCTKDVEVK